MADGNEAKGSKTVDALRLHADRQDPEPKRVITALDSPLKNKQVINLEFPDPFNFCVQMKAG